MHIKEALAKIRALRPGETRKINGHVVTRKYQASQMIHGRYLTGSEPLYYVDTWGKTPIFEERVAYACVQKGKR